MQKLLSCPYCDTSFTSYKNKTRHIKKRCKEKLRNIHLINRADTSGEQLLKIKPIKFIRCLSCYICLLNLKGQEDLKLHLISSQNEKLLTCPYCEASFTRYETKITHIKLSCKKYFRKIQTNDMERNTDKNNIQTELGNNEQLLVCPYCSKSFTSYKIRKRHVIVSCKEYLRMLQIDKSNNRDIQNIIPEEGQAKSEISKLEDNLPDDDYTENNLKDEINMKTYEATIYPSLEDNINDTDLNSNTEEDCITNCEKCGYTSNSLLLNRLHIISHHAQGPQLFQRLPDYLTNRKFTSKEEFKEELERYLASSDCINLM